MLLQVKNYDLTSQTLTISVPLLKSETGKQEKINMTALLNFHSMSYSVNSPVQSFALQYKPAMKVDIHFKQINQETIANVISSIRTAFPSATTEGFQDFVNDLMGRVNPNPIEDTRFAPRQKIL